MACRSRRPGCVDSRWYCVVTLDTIVDGTTLTLCLVEELANDVAYLPWQTAETVFTDHPSRIDVVVLDLFAVTFTDSTGLTALVRVRELADANSARCRLRGVQPRTRQVLEMTGLLATFDTLS